MIYKKKNYADPNLMVGHSYIRQLQGSSSIFKNAFVINYRPDSVSWLKTPSTLYRKFILNHYMNWRV